MWKAALFTIGFLNKHIIQYFNKRIAFMWQSDNREAPDSVLLIHNIKAGSGWNTDFEYTGPEKRTILWSRYGTVR